ncbi:FCS-Like Zinc finger 17-like [Quercus robur]|uniref:FCS-Like Zinc finger 17-like n=1 Tax=Quercus robur TaxID=38942 RepID=UPI002163C0A8|nr:FCS-Like Zinc finger 17-like [Quercus robur]
MLLKFKSPFKMEDEVNKHSKQHNKSSYAGHTISNNHTSLAVGLQILTQISHGESNILVKSILKLTQGDQDFCSIECRNRQIVLDEMRELETSTKNMVASYRHSHRCNSDRRETQILLEEIRQRHEPRPIRYQINWAIVS